jgi:dTDP-4-dehydrorhamnose reductase
VNALGARNVAQAAGEVGSRIVHISTDYVFDGSATTPYSPEHPQNPRTAYGRTKAAGEWAVRLVNRDALIVRTAWLYGAQGPSFVHTILNLAAKQHTISVVADQIGQPTSAQDLSDFLYRLVLSDRPGGFYHGTNSGKVTRFGFARTIFAVAGFDPARVLPCTTKDFPTAATRPSYSVLQHDLHGPSLPPWRDGLIRYMDALDISVPSAKHTRTTCLRQKL